MLSKWLPGSWRFSLFYKQKWLMNMRFCNKKTKHHWKERNFSCTRLVWFECTGFALCLVWTVSHRFVPYILVCVCVCVCVCLCERVRVRVESDCLIFIVVVACKTLMTRNVHEASTSKPWSPCGWTLHSGSWRQGDQR